MQKKMDINDLAKVWWDTGQKGGAYAGITRARAATADECLGSLDGFPWVAKGILKGSAAVCFAGDV